MAHYTVSIRPPPDGGGNLTPTELREALIVFQSAPRLTAGGIFTINDLIDQIEKFQSAPRLTAGGICGLPERTIG